MVQTNSILNIYSQPFHGLPGDALPAELLAHRLESQTTVRAGAATPASVQGGQPPLPTETPSS